MGSSASRNYNTQRKIGHKRMTKHKFDGTILERNTSTLDQVQVRILHEEPDLHIPGTTVLDISFQDGGNEEKIIIVEIMNRE